MATSDATALKSTENAWRARLTPREIEILELIGQGQSTKAIADGLDISLGTVATHRRNAMDKLKAANAAALVRLAIRYGYIQP